MDVLDDHDDRSVARCLLKGQFLPVGAMRDRHPERFAALPGEIREVANRFLGQGRADRPGKDALRTFLDQHYRSRVAWKFSWPQVHPWTWAISFSSPTTTNQHHNKPTTPLCPSHSRNSVRTPRPLNQKLLTPAPPLFETSPEGERERAKLPEQVRRARSRSSTARSSASCARSPGNGTSRCRRSARSAAGVDIVRRRITYQRVRVCERSPTRTIAT